MGDGIAQALDGRVVRVRMPDGAATRASRFMADIENLTLELAAPAREGGASTRAPARS